MSDLYSAVSASCGKVNFKQQFFVLAKQVYLVPKGICLDAYASIFKDGTLVYAMGYSVIVTLIFTLLGMIVCTCAAYPLSKKRLKGRTFFAAADVSDVFQCRIDPDVSFNERSSFTGYDVGTDSAADLFSL